MRRRRTYQSVETNGAAPGSLQVVLKSQSDELSGKKNGEDCAPERLAYQVCGLGMVDKISSGSRRPRRAPCYPLSIADRVISQSLGRGKLETKVS